ncbi:MAG: sortase [bacterium]|nr:sortase [bacterium]
MRTKDKRKSLKLVGFLLIILGLSTLSFKMISYIFKNIEEKENITNFKDNQEQKVEDDKETITEDKADTTPKAKEQYIALLEIPKINLEKGLYDIKSKNNNVDKNIQILKESNMPDVENGNLILAGHSGNGQKAYFKDLVKLTKDDIATIVYKNRKYSYKLVDNYEIEKTGKTTFNCSLSTKTLTLITCKEDTNKQLIYIFEEIEESDYNG